MNEITLVTKRGTSISRREVKTIWTGKDFVDYQEKKISVLPKGVSISKEKGTTAIVISEYPRFVRKLLPGKIFISTARGTSRRLL